MPDDFRNILKSLGAGTFSNVMHQARARQPFKMFLSFAGRRNLGIYQPSNNASHEDSSCWKSPVMEDLEKRVHKLPPSTARPREPRFLGRFLTRCTPNWKRRSDFSGRAITEPGGEPRIATRQTACSRRAWCFGRLSS